MSNRPPLAAEEVIKAIKHGNPSRVPMMIKFWNWAGGNSDRDLAIQQIQQEYPEDFYAVPPRFPTHYDEVGSPNYIPGHSWLRTPPPPPETLTAHDANQGMPSWDMLDSMLANLPDPNCPQLLEGMREKIQQNAAGRYVLAYWWGCLYERVWSLRGMENLMCDFYEVPDKVHRLMDALTDFYVAAIHRTGRELPGLVNGFFTSDDIGMQTGPMFSPAIFREFFKPRYKRIFDAVHQYNMHFWLHTCGNVLPFIEDFIEIGLDVIHPIQKYTMDEREVAAKFGGRIAFWTGMDVQQILPRGTPEDVRREVRFMMDTFDTPRGGCLITAGNGVTEDNPVENLRAFFDEAYNYGLAHRQQFA